jgi:hypothetical protein
MSAAMVITVKPAALRNYRRSAATKAQLKAKAQAVAAAAGPGHLLDYQRGKDRARYSVRTHSYQAMYREARRRNLTIALGAARG